MNRLTFKKVECKDIDLILDGKSAIMEVLEVGNT